MKNVKNIKKKIIEFKNDNSNSIEGMSLLMVILFIATCATIVFNFRVGEDMLGSIIQLSTLLIAFFVMYFSIIDRRESRKIDRKRDEDDRKREDETQKRHNELIERLIKNDEDAAIRFENMVKEHREMMERMDKRHLEAMERADDRHKEAMERADKRHEDFMARLDARDEERRRERIAYRKRRYR